MNKTLQHSIQQCQSGNRKAFKVIYESFANYIYSICLRYEIPEQDRKDVMQEIFAEIYLSLKKYDEQKGEFRHWLRGVTVHVIFAYWRKRKKKHFPTLELKEVEDLSEEDASSHFDQEALKQNIDQLPSGYRMVVNLFMIDGYSHKEIAEMLQIKESTSRSQLTRAIRQLKSRLQKRKTYETI
ncbi:MAG: sigma-70 family RNA polymerase sigma factor [Bacteroidota bacterium]